MKKYVLLFFLLTFQGFLAQKSPNIVNVPKGGALLSGETMNNYVWRSAIKFNTESGEIIYLIHDNDYLYIGFRGIFAPWSHLYINNRNKVYVLHVTASMGKVVYSMNHYGTWYPDRRFNWKMRHEEYDPNKKIDDIQFLKEEGWITNVKSDGDRKEVVFKIAIKSFDKKNINIAFVYGLKGNVYQFWPKTLNDDTLKPEIFTGYNPSELRFDFSKWVLLKLAD